MQYQSTRYLLNGRISLLTCPLHCSCTEVPERSITSLFSRDRSFTSSSPNLRYPDSFTRTLSEASSDSTNIPSALSPSQCYCPPIFFFFFFFSLSSVFLLSSKSLLYPSLISPLFPSFTPVHPIGLPNTLPSPQSQETREDFHLHLLTPTSLLQSDSKAEIKPSPTCPPQLPRPSPHASPLTSSFISSSAAFATPTAAR